MTIRVLLADDQSEILDGLSMMLGAENDLVVVATVRNGRVAVDATAKHAPDVVVMDIRMPVMDGIEATRLITADREDARKSTAVLALTTFDQDELLYGALQAGASGYMLKHAAPAGLANAVRRVANGGSWIDPSVAGKVIHRLRDMAPRDASGRPSLEMLSRREVEVLSLMADGPSNAELAVTLGVSEATVKTHVSRLLMKTGSRDRAQLVAVAFRSGLVKP